MVDYKTLYHLMVNASERTLEAMEKQNYGEAKDILIKAEQEAEERYIRESEDSR